MANIILLSWVISMLMYLGFNVDIKGDYNMIKAITTKFFPQSTPIKNIKQLTPQKDIIRSTFLKQDLLTGFTVDTFIKSNKPESIKCVAPEIFY